MPEHSAAGSLARMARSERPIQDTSIQRAMTTRLRASFEALLPVEIACIARTRGNVIRESARNEFWLRTTG
jgi:hypothetical protein